MNRHCEIEHVHVHEAARKNLWHILHGPVNPSLIDKRMYFFKVLLMISVNNTVALSILQTNRSATWQLPKVPFVRCEINRYYKTGHKIESREAGSTQTCTDNSFHFNHSCMLMAFFEFFFYYDFYALCGQSVQILQQSGWISQGPFKSI